MRPSLVIFNPIAGRGLVSRVKPRVIESLRDAGLIFETADTTHARDGARLAREAVRDGCRSIIAVGGDGIIHEVVNGLMEAGLSPDEVTLGIVPAGSGNDFVKMLNLPTEDVAAACACISRGQTHLVDVGRINSLISDGQALYSADAGRPGYFTNMLGIGFTGLVAHQSQAINWLTGVPLYLIAVLRTLALTYRTPEMHIDLDGSPIRQNMTEVAIANGRCQGGGFWMTPDAEVDDGFFDLAIARDLSRIGILRLIPHLMRGTHVDKEPVTMARARRVTIDSAYPLPVQADGEILATQVTHMELEVMPKALRVIA